MGEENHIDNSTHNTISNQSEMNSEITENTDTQSIDMAEQINLEEIACVEEVIADEASESDDTISEEPVGVNGSTDESGESEDENLGCFTVEENHKVDFDIKVGIIPDSEMKSTKEQTKLFNEQEAACSIIKSVDNTDNAIKRKYFS